MKNLYEVLKGNSIQPLPVWFMRQAGRYLPEYRALRADVPDFLSLCYNPKLAAEVTLQPIRRFGFDGAILFSDILVIPDALGQEVRFEAGEGPKLGQLDLDKLEAMPVEKIIAHLNPVFETIDRVKSDLPREVTFLGFCGAPWTVASYMIAGRGGDDQDAARRFEYSQPIEMKRLINILVRASIHYLNAQISSGVAAVQIFESWASSLSPHLLQKLSLDPISEIIKGVRSVHPSTPVIVFAKGAGQHLSLIQSQTEADAQGIDWSVDINYAREAVGSNITLQGNLDPIAILSGGSALDKEIDLIKEKSEHHPWIFNLGHGIRKETPIVHVEQALKRIRD